MSLKIGVRLVMSGFVVVASLATGAVYAQLAKKVINAATLTTWVPFEFKDPKSGELMGFNHDLFEAMAKKVGVKVNWIEFGYQDLVSFAPLKTGRVDIYAAGGLSDTPERREAGVSFIDYVYEPYGFFTLSANADRFKSTDSLCGKNVAVTRASGPTIGLLKRWNEENCTKGRRPDVVVVGADNNTEQKLGLKQGRVEAGIIGAGTLANSNKEEGNIYIPLGKPLNKNMYGMPFLKENKDLGAAFKKALDELIADGTYGQLLHKWGLPTDSSIGQESSINAGPSLN